MNPIEIAQRETEERAWQGTLRGLAIDYVKHMAENDRQPLYVFFGNPTERVRFLRELQDKLGEIDLPVRPRQRDVLPANPMALRGHSRRLVAVHQKYPWYPGGRAVDDAREAAHMVSYLNQANGWSQ